MRCSLIVLALAWPLCAQESDAGFDLRATVTAQTIVSDLLTQPPRGGAPVAAGFRAIFYPTVKLNRHWTLAGAYQLESRPLAVSSFMTQGYGVNGSLLTANVGYTAEVGGAALMVKAGELPTAFGSFPLRYDDRDNPLADVPMEYGYYYEPVKFRPVTGVEADWFGKHWDARAQFANSSPVNPRWIDQRDQYANWSGGAGATIRQGLRFGASAFRGPYLYRGYAYYFPGEAPPATLPATGMGIDGEWGQGHWNLRGELQKFLLPYRAIPDLTEHAGYIEGVREIGPRWYGAVRIGYTSNSYSGYVRSYEGAAGYRISAAETIKADFEYRQTEYAQTYPDRIFTIQFIGAIHPPAVAW